MADSTTNITTAVMVAAMVFASELSHAIEPLAMWPSASSIPQAAQVTATWMTSGDHARLVLFDVEAVRLDLIFEHVGDGGAVVFLDELRQLFGRRDGGHDGGDPAQHGRHRLGPLELAQADDGHHHCAHCGAGNQRAGRLRGPAALEDLMPGRGGPLFARLAQRLEQGATAGVGELGHMMLMS